jgi:uncharacterized membrane-anchored protein YitT (DUF2179 family)
VTSRLTKFRSEFFNSLLILLGVLFAGMGIKGFLVSSQFIDGGATGVSMLLSKLTPIDLSVWILVVNLPFIFIAYRYLGLGFSIRSILGIFGLSLAVAIVPYPDVTPDFVLTAVFGGLFIGSGIGFAIRGGAVLDGTEVVALLISRRSKVLRVGDVILIFNVVLFLIALKFLGVEQALYSILTYLTAAKMLDFVIYGIEGFNAVLIVSSKSDEIKTQITRQLGRGVTVLQGYGGHAGEERPVLYCVVTRLESGLVRNIVNNLDDRAFMTINTLAHAEGGVLKKAGDHVLVTKNSAG